MKRLYLLIGGLVLLLILCSTKNVETYNNCNGCGKPNKMYGNCTSTINKDDNGNCYKKCPYKCNDYSGNNCQNDLDCKECGSTNFRINCDGTINPQWGDNTILGNNNKSCDYKTQNLEGKLRIITHDGNKYLWIIFINILSIKDNKSCVPIIEGKVIQLNKNIIIDRAKKNEESKNMSYSDIKKHVINQFKSSIEKLIKTKNSIQSYYAIANSEEAKIFDLFKKN